MKLLLTGADGFTGRQFADLAAAAGHKVVPLRANLTNFATLVEEVASVKPEAVVHLAGISFVGHAHDDAFYAVNVVGTTNLLDALAKLDAPPRIVLLASSANVYGNTERSPIVESEPFAPVNHYATSKVAMEHMARCYMDRLKIVITRPFNYTGPGQDVNFLIPKLATHFAARRPSISLGNLHVEREFNDVRMVCQSYLGLLAYGKAGEVYNVCSGKPYTLRHVVDLFERLTGHAIEVLVDPAFVRQNEVHRLCGNPSKLDALFSGCGVHVDAPSLEGTIGRMLDFARQASATLG